jgi:hypothetical protein
VGKGLLISSRFLLCEAAPFKSGWSASTQASHYIGQQFAMLPLSFVKVTSSTLKLTVPIVTREAAPVGTLEKVLQTQTLTS